MNFDKLFSALLLREKTKQFAGSNILRCAFSLVEILVALIIVSLITAAMAPVITKRLKSSGIIISGGGSGGGGGGGATLACGDIPDCILCKDSICYTCIKDKETCETGNFLDEPSCSCKPCSDIMSGCTSCTKGGVCTSSTACSVFGDYCIQCNVAECEQCRSGYNLAEDKKLCIPDQIDCVDPNCAKCLTQADKCDVCNGGYDLEENECVTARLVDYTFKDSSGNDIKATGTALAQSGNEWKIKIIKSGTINFTKLYSVVDVFVVGAGGGGTSNFGAGGGGYTKTELNVVLNIGEDYSITVGQPNGGTSSGFGIWARGGNSNHSDLGGGGGSGGNGWGTCSGATNGANGGTQNRDEGYIGGLGQITTTREFGEEASGTFAGESKGKLYANGGKSDACTAPAAGAVNTGNGGTGAKGGSGIVIVRGYGPIDDNLTCKVRNCEECTAGNDYSCKTCAKGYKVDGSNCVPNPPVVYTYTNKGVGSVLSMDDLKWKIKFTQSGTFTPSKVPGTGAIDVFVVGGGGAATPVNYGGGAGGYTTNGSSTLFKGTGYSIVVGGQAQLSSGFGVQASGGASNSGDHGGAGGSGGSGWGSCNRASDGGNGRTNGEYRGGSGQGSTTREFGESTGWLYSYGGCGGYYAGITSGDLNTGNGGSNGGAGGTGIVIIRGEY